MGARLTDSAEYAHLWGTDEVRAIFDQDARRQAWIEILVALADAQAELGIIPRSSAATIAEQARADRLDLDLLAAETRRTSHSTLGLHRRVEGDRARRGRRARVLRRHGAGPDRHLDGAGVPARR